MRSTRLRSRIASVSIGFTSSATHRVVRSRLAEMSRQISEQVARVLPQAEIAIIPDVGHAMPLEDPDAVAEAIAAFVRRHGAA